MRKVLVSACLCGDRVRWDARLREDRSDVLDRWLAEGRVVRLCPEVEGGLPVPRPAAERQSDGRVRTLEGLDVTDAFARGAAHAVALAALHDVAFAVLKEGSPSCGSGFVWDGRFTRTKLEGGAGVTVEALRRAGVRCFSEREWAEADALLTSISPLRGVPRRRSDGK